MIESRIASRRAWKHAATSLVLAAVWALFAHRHIAVFMKTGQWPFLVFCISETVQAAMFVVRFRPATVSRDPVDWAVAIAGTAAPLFFVPAAGGMPAYASTLIVIGTLLQLLGVISINRSFAIVAAKRKVRTTGMYRVVRHPIYASYLVLFSGYVWGNATPWNVALYLSIACCIAARIAREERHLRVDPGYEAYCDRVQYRLVPFVF
jgi:protein-S-isoprenylcysteine O-methyltransferase Ste14